MYQKLVQDNENNIISNNKNHDIPSNKRFGPRREQTTKTYHSTNPVESLDHQIPPPPPQAVTTTIAMMLNSMMRRKNGCIPSAIGLLFLAVLVVVVVVGPISVMSSTICTEPCVPGSEDIMKPKDHGTCPSKVQSKLRWDVDWDVTDRICCLNRRYAEYSGYWEQTTKFVSDIKQHKKDETTITFYDPVTGIPLFTAPRDRTWADFVKESHRHGWPSFRDSEVNWDNVRVLPDGETVSVNGTHLGHNLPDGSGNRYCINLVSVAGYPVDE